MRSITASLYPPFWSKEKDWIWSDLRARIVSHNSEGGKTCQGKESVPFRCLSHEALRQKTLIIARFRGFRDQKVANFAESES